MITKKNPARRAALFARSVLCMLALLGCVCGCARTQTQLRPSEKAAPLFSLLQEEFDRAAARSGFALKASLACRDKNQDFHFLLDAWHDGEARYTRLILTGVLDAAVWAELIASENEATLSLIHENRVVTGGRDELYLNIPGGGQVGIGEILSLVELKPAVDMKRRIRGSASRGDNDILFLEEDQYTWSAIEFSPQGALLGIYDIVGGLERARIVYENRSDKDGIARKQSIISRTTGSEIIIWLSSFDSGWRYTRE